jgi:hypothetical protein
MTDCTVDGLFPSQALEPCQETAESVAVYVAVILQVHLQVMKSSQVRLVLGSNPSFGIMVS